MSPRAGAQLARGGREGRERRGCPTRTWAASSRPQGPPAALGRHRVKRPSLETASRTPLETRFCQRSDFPTK